MVVDLNRQILLRKVYPVDLVEVLPPGDDHTLCSLPSALPKNRQDDDRKKSDEDPELARDLVVLITNLGFNGVIVSFHSINEAVVCRKGADSSILFETDCLWPVLRSGCRSWGWGLDCKGYGHDSKEYDELH